MPERDCDCMREGPLPGSRTATYLGLDHAGSRFAEVEIEECTDCRRRWIHYEFAPAERPQEARWFRGVLPPGTAERVTAEKALEILGSLGWYLQGGAHFGTPCERTTGPPEIPR